MNRVIDRDLEFYQTSIEHDRAMLQRAPVIWETYWRRRVESTRLVIATLLSLQRAIDAQPQPDKLSLEP